MKVAKSWFTDSAELPQWCFLVLRTYILWARTRRCSLSWWALSAQVCTNLNPEDEVKIKLQFISVTEYLTPDTPDLLDIRLAWQSLGYNDQAFEFISLIDKLLIFVTHEKRSKVFAGQGDYELEAQVGSNSCSVSPNRCHSSIIIKAALFQVIHSGGRSSLHYQLSAGWDRRILWWELATSVHGGWPAKPRGEWLFRCASS